MQFATLTALVVGVFAARINGLPSASTPSEEMMAALESAMEEHEAQNSTEPRSIQLTKGLGYATFYDDHNCRVNPSKAVYMGNAGCVSNQPGRNSVYLQPGTDIVNYVHMVWTPGTQCNCQDDCAAVPKTADGGNMCWDLAGHQIARSFRFINQGCAKNNCAPKL